MRLGLLLPTAVVGNVAFQESLLLPSEVAFSCIQRKRLVAAYTRTCDHRKRGEIRRSLESQLSQERLRDYALVFPVGFDAECGVSPVVDTSSALLTVHLQGRFPEHYSSLPMKTAMLLHNLQNCEAHYDWLIKMDEDQFVDFRTLDTYLTAQESVARFMNSRKDVLQKVISDTRVLNALVRQSYRYWWIGYEIVGNVIAKESRNAELEYNAPYYPVYMSGPFYILKSDSVKVLGEELHRNKTFYNNEDALIGILAENMKTRASIGDRVILTDISEPNIMTTLMFDFPEIICRSTNTSEGTRTAAEDGMSPRIKKVPCHRSRVISWPEPLQQQQQLSNDEDLSSSQLRYWTEHWFYLIAHHFTQDIK